MEPTHWNGIVSFEKDWSSVYIDVVNKLRRRKGDPSALEKWLVDRSKKPNIDLRSYFASRGWDETHHAVRLVDAATDHPWATIGLLLAIRTQPPNETLRLAFPSSISEVGTYRMLFPPENIDHNWFPGEQRLRHQHAQINFSDKFGPKGGKDVCAGMLWASMVGNTVLYCGDVTKLRTDQAQTLGSLEHEIPMFWSVGSEQEKFLGMSSILYVPIRSSNGGGNSQEADLVIGLYSPLPFIFGTHRDFADGYCDPEDRYCQGPLPSEWLDEFTSRFLLSRILPTLLIDIDNAYRRGMYDFAKIVELSQAKVDAIRDALKSEATKLKQEHGIEANQLIDRLLQAVESGNRDDPHHRILELYRQAFKNSETLDVKRLAAEPLTSADVGVIYRYLRTQNDQLISCGADERKLFFESLNADPEPDVSGADLLYLEKNKVAEAVASIMNHYIRNARNAESKVIIVDHQLSGDRVVFSVENEVAYSDEIVRQYWLVRQGQIAQSSNNKQQSGTHGLGLYLTREISRYLRVVVEFDMPVPELAMKETTWTSKVSAPFQGQ